MGAVFASAARAPLTSVASVVEMTGDYTLTLPVMLAVAIATALSRALSYGTIYTTKLLRRGTDIDRPPAADPFEDLTAADAMRPFTAPLTRAARDPAGPPADRTARRCPARSPISTPPGAVRQRVPRPGAAPARALRPRRAAGDLRRRAAPPGLDHQPERAAGRRPPDARRPRRRAGAARRRTALPGPQAAPTQPPTPLRGYQVLEITIPAGSPAAGQALGDTTWPPGWVPVTVLDSHTLRDPDPGITLAPGDRVNLLAREPHHPQPAHPHDQPDGHPHSTRPAAQAPAPASGDQPTPPGPGRIRRKNS